MVLMFVHLHVHTEYSLLDGMCRIDSLIKKAVQLGMPAVAITDHGNMHGVIEFYTKAKEAGIKPVIGMEAYIAPGPRTEKKAGGIKDASFHITLLAKDYTGYKNLMKLSTIGYLEGFYYKPRVDKEVLKKYCEGLIAFSGCLKGEIAHFISGGRYDKAEEILNEYVDIFGKENFFMELHDHGIEEQKAVNKWKIDTAKKYGLKLVATNDCHYVDSKEAFMHEVLLCIQTATNLDDPKRMRFQTQEFYFKDESTMRMLFPENPDAIENTVRIADRCNVELDFSRHYLPTFTPPEEYSIDGYLRKLCEEGLKHRYSNITKEIKERLDHELGIINKMNYPSYFLIVWDFIKYAKEHGIPVGPGRGSAAGSIVSYVLGITNLDPIAYGLVFERFLNPSRVTLPDIDIDFCDKRRDEVIDYVKTKYGKENVAQIITFGTLGAKAVIRDVARGLSFSYAEADQIAKLVPDELNITLKRAIELEPRFETLMREDPKVAKLIEISFGLEGLVRNASTHAAGLVISEKPLTEYVPLCTGTKGEVVTQFTMGPLEKVGMLKMDFLGLKTLSVIQSTIELAEKNTGTKIDPALSNYEGKVSCRKCGVDIEKIPMDDKAVFSLLNKGDTIGVFQLESTGMRDLAKKIGINEFKDIIALVALFRPGPMNMLEDYVERKHGKVQIKYMHPLLEPILKDTYGVMLYQEQVMKCANVAAGFSMAEADILRQIMGKKIVEKMEEQRERFIQGAVKNGINQNTAGRIFETMASFAGYGFNASHSAAYAMIVYQTAYLKAHYPLEYMAAVLTSEMGNTDKVTRYIEECRNMSIEILPPDINQSEADFTPIFSKGDTGKQKGRMKGSVRFGLAAIKNVGVSAIGSITESRKKSGFFKSFMDFLERVDNRAVNKKVLESLIKCGAMDSFGYPRRRLVAGLGGIIEAYNKMQKIKNSGQTSLFEIFDEDKKGMHNLELPQIDEWPKSQLLNFEKELLGFYVTGHPLSEYQGLIKHYNTVNSRQLTHLNMNTTVRIGGIITGLRRTVTKRDSKRMAILTVEDLEGPIEAVVYPNAYEQYNQYIEENKTVIIKGIAQAKEDKPRVVVNEILPLETAPEEYAYSVQINIFERSINDDILEKLNNILRRFPGNCPINLSITLPEGEKVTMEVNGDLKVTPNKECVEGIEELLGTGSAVVKMK